MSTGADIVRAHGANMRVTLVNAFTNFGEKTGTRIVRRMAYEVGAFALETMGRAKAAEIMYAAGDDLIHDRMPVDVEPEATIIDLTEPDEEKPVTEPNKVLTSSVAPATTWSWTCFGYGVLLGGFVVAYHMASL